MTDSLKLLWAKDQPVGKNSDNSDHLQETDNQATGGIRTRNPSKRTAATNAIGRAATGIGSINQYGDNARL
jgi:hypothetical protein